MIKPMIPLLEYCLNSCNTGRRDDFLELHHEHFESTKDQVRFLLSETEFYHGTGAYHHFYEDSKYSGGYIGIKSSIESILSEGLIPHHDPFNFVFETGVLNTTSLTGNNVYSRCYADLFFEEGKGLDYYYGSSLFWGSLIAGKLFFDRSIEFLRDGYEMRKRIPYEEETSHECKDGKKNHIRKAYEGWTRSFRKDGKYEGKNFAHVTLAKSDIPDNFGIIIGVKKGVVSPLQIKYDSVSHYETRTDKAIVPSEFTHLQAPLKRIHEVSSVVEKNNINVPIIPTEFVEAIRFEDGIEKALSRFN